MVPTTNSSNNNNSSSSSNVLFGATAVIIFKQPEFWSGRAPLGLPQLYLLPKILVIHQAAVAWDSS